MEGLGREKGNKSKAIERRGRGRRKDVKVMEGKEGE